MRTRTSRACRMVSQLPRRPVAEKGVRARGYASYRTAPLVKPPPKPTSTTLSPGPEGIDANALQQADPGIAPIDAELDATERVAAGAPRQALYMNGQKVFKFATSVMPAAIEEVLRRANLTIDDVQFIVPHQANLRIIKYAAKRMGRCAPEMMRVDYIRV